MSDPSFPEPAPSLGRRAAMFPLSRLLAFALALLACGFVLGSAFALAAPWLFRDPARVDALLNEGQSPDFDNLADLELFARGQTLVYALVAAPAAVLAWLFLGRKVERRSWREMGLEGSGVLRETAWGFGAGALLTTFAALGGALVGWHSFGAGPWWAGGLLAPFYFVALQAALMFCVALMEEIVCRAVLFRVVEDWTGSWIALLLSSFLFGIGHVANPNGSWAAGLFIAVEAGVLLGAVYMLTRRIWAVVGLHWAWNFFLGPVWGLPVSGVSFPGLFHLRETGPDLWTGGAFGPEAGLLGALPATALGALFLWLAWKKGQVRPPDWKRWGLPRGGAPAAQDAPSPEMGPDPETAS